MALGGALAVTVAVPQAMSQVTQQTSPARRAPQTGPQATPPVRQPFAEPRRSKPGSVAPTAPVSEPAGRGSPTAEETVAAVDRAYALLNGGQLDEARGLADRLRRQAEQLGDDGLMIQVLSILADLAMRDGDFVVAEQHARHLLPLMSDYPDAEAAAWATLGEALREQGRFDDAAEALRRALDMNAAHGASPQNEANWLNHLAILRGDQGRFGEGEELFRRAVEVAEMHDLEEARIVASANLARNLYQQSRHAEAEAGLRQAVENVRNREGEASINYGIGVANLAIELQAQGRHAEALPGLRQALGVLQRARGRDNADNVLTINALARSIEVVEGPTAALPLYREAVAISQATRLPGHPQTATVTTDLAKTLLASGQPEPAIEVLRDLADAVFGRATAATRVNATQAAAEFDRTRSLFRLQVQAAWDLAF